MSEKLQDIQQRCCKHQFFDNGSGAITSICVKCGYDPHPAIAQQSALDILNAAPVDDRGRICLTAEAAQEIALALKSRCEQEPSEEALSFVQAAHSFLNGRLLESGALKDWPTLRVAANALIQRAASVTSRGESLREQAEDNVEAVRGSSDVPGFDACVKAEEARLARNAALEEAARWHDERRRNTPDAFEMEFHEVSGAAIRALKESGK